VPTTHSVHGERELPLEPETPISFSHLSHTLHAYAVVIFLSMTGVAIAYSIVAIALYLFAPRLNTTSLAFRLDFEGAERRQYPNGLRFSPSEIVSAPVLVKVFNDNRLERFTNFGNFSKSIVILESNPAFEQLSAQFQTRLADPKLGPIDRERIENEFEMKRASLAKNEYSINYLRGFDRGIPETLIRKILSDTLATWAQFAINEQHALDYRVSVLSPQILDVDAVEPDDYITRIQVLRSKVFRVIDNVSDLQRMPGADLARTRDHLSLNEIQFRLDEIVRFRFEPLVGLVRNSGLIANPALTIRFLENQLAYDQRLLQARQSEADTVRQALAVYTEQRGESTASKANGTTGKTDAARANGETVMPQLSDSFLDRLLTLTTQSADTQYRQRIVNDYRQATMKMIPLQQAVAYDTQILNEVRNSAVASQKSDPSAVRRQLEQSVEEVRQLILKMNEIYQVVSRNTNPSMQIYAITETPVSHTETAFSGLRLLLYGLLVLLLAFPITVVACLLHNRVREEEAEEGYEEAVAHAGT
jgi:hypothetical protein